MKVLVTGYNGQLGYDVIRVLKKDNIECLGIDINELDITDAKAVEDFLKEYNPDVLVHCAAYTQVDNAEDNKELAYNVNVNGTKYLADACKSLDIKFCFFSTDYVFSGEGNTEHLVDEKKCPVNYYGETKAVSEDYIINNLTKYFIIRISWVFGINGKNFIRTMLNLVETHDTLTVVDDQVGSPTYTYDLAYLIKDMIQTEKYGIYQATNEGICSWNEFAKEIFKLSNKNVTVNPVQTKDYKSKAKRPLNSRMSKQALTDNGFKLLPTWQDALKRYLEELKKL